jgi:putative oxidoreductase
MSNTATLDRSNAAAGGLSLPADLALTLGRLLLAALFLISGLGKIAAPAATLGYIHSVGLPFPEGAYVAAVLIEVAGGLALVLGFKTRWVALAMAAFAIATAVAFHANFGDQNQFIHFFKNISIAGGLLQVAVFGAGRISLDARARR